MGRDEVGVAQVLPVSGERFEIGLELDLDSSYLA